MPTVRRNKSKEDIKAMVWKRGMTLRQISLHAGLGIDAASEALRRPYPSANHAIAEFLGSSVHDLWPRWFDQNGNRITSHKHKQTIAHRPPVVSAESATQF